MNTLKAIFIFALVAFTTILSAQPDNAAKALNLKIQQLSFDTYGVFVKPEGITPSERTITGSGQVTIVAPVDFTYANLENFGGSWVENARVNSPIEAADKAYISFGFVTDLPKINIYPNEETLLFTFTTDAAFAGTFSLIENDDPFNTPNSYDTNPGNDLGIIAGNYKGDEVQAIFTNNKGKNKRNKKEESALSARPE